MRKKIEDLYKKLVLNKIISEVYDLTYYYNDEPRFPLFNVIENTDYQFYNREAYCYTSMGIDNQNSELALLKALIEALEFASAYSFSKKDIIFDTYSKIKKNALNPNIYTNKVIVKNALLNENISDLKIGWIKAMNLTQKRKLYVPIQLIHPNYIEYSKYVINIEEPYLTGHDHSGLAGGTSLNSAIIRGIYEVIERDAATLFLLNKIVPLRISLDHCNNETKKIINKCLSYKLYPIIFELPTDFFVPTYICLLIDSTGVGPVISSGYGTLLNPQKAIKKALLEAFSVRIDFRTRINYRKDELIQVKYNNFKLDDIILDGIYYSAPGTLKYTKHLLDHMPKISKSNHLGQKYIKKNKLPYLLKLFKKKGFEIFYKNITIPTLRKEGFFVVKVLIPGMQPQIVIDEPTKIFPKRYKYYEQNYKRLKRSNT